MTVLALDTSTPYGGVTLLADGAVVFEDKFTADRSHSSSLFDTLEKARALREHVDQIVIGLGPGSYAGVRIAIAAAIGLRLALGAKLVGIPSVAALETPATEYIVIGDARRDTFYFSHVKDGVCVEGPLLATEAELRQRLEAIGDLPVLATAEVPQFPVVKIALPSATNLARLAAEGRGITVTGDLEPIYLREPHITQPKTVPGIPPRR